MADTVGKAQQRIVGKPSSGFHSRNFDPSAFLFRRGATWPWSDALGAAEMRLYHNRFPEQIETADAVTILRSPSGTGGLCPRGGSRHR
jgi:hypothetical protein